jgi:hypothetical protein
VAVCNNCHQLETDVTFKLSCNIFTCDVKCDGVRISGLVFVRGILFDPVFGGISGRYPIGQGNIPFEARWSPQEWTRVLELVYFRLVLPHLATTTTRCDLNHFYQNRQDKPPSHDTAPDPVHYPYSDCRIVNMLVLYRASDRKSLDFYQSYLAERLSEKDSGTIHWIPRIYATRDSFQLLDVMQDI